MPYYSFVIHLLFYITMALSTDLILFEDIFYFPHFMKIFLVLFFFCRYSFFFYRLVSSLLPNLLFTVFKRFFPKTCFYRFSLLLDCIFFYFLCLKFFITIYISVSFYCRNSFFEMSLHFFLLLEFYYNFFYGVFVLVFPPMESFL